MDKDINDFLNGGGGKAAKFEVLGDKVTGKITEAKLSQQTSMEDNTPLTWSDGSPRMQLVITLQTEDREGEEDDGVRRVYAKGGNFEIADGTGKSMKDAIAEAVKASGAKSLEEGGVLRTEVVNRLQEIIAANEDGQDILLLDRLCHVAREEPVLREHISGVPQSAVAEPLQLRHAFADTVFVHRTRKRHDAQGVARPQRDRLENLRHR